MYKISRSIIRIGQLPLWVFSKFLTRVVLHVTATKDSIVPTTTSRIVISNHVSLFDPFMFVGLLSWREMSYINPIRAILAKWYYYSPLLPFAYLVGCFPAKPLAKIFTRYSGTRAAIYYGNHGCTLGIYPEGKRVKDAPIPAKYGVVRILEGLEQPHVYLCHIVKEPARPGHYTVTIKRSDETAKIGDPQEIMNKILRLGI